MLQQELLDCPVCYETKEKKDFFPLKCCGNCLCKSCEPQVRSKHGDSLPGHPNHRFIRCPLCRQMESVPFELVTQLISRNVPRNIHEFSLDMAPNFQLNPEQQNQRDRQERDRLIELHERRRIIERQERERRIQRERERLQRLEQEQQENRYGANLLHAMRNMDPRRLFQRRQRLEEPIQENLTQPGWVVQEPNPPGIFIPPAHWGRVPQPTARRAPTPPPHINLIARRQPRIAAPINQPNRTQLCSNNNCHHRTVFRCRIHPNVVCCRNCVCTQCQ